MQPINLKHEGILCVPKQEAFDMFCRDAVIEPCGVLGEMSLFRFPGTNTLRHEPFYAIVGADDTITIQSALHAVIAAGALTVIHLGYAPLREPTIAAGQLLVVVSVECDDGTTLSATPGMVRKLKNRLANHGLDGRLTQLSESPMSQGVVGDALISTVFQTMQSHGLPAGGLFVVDAHCPGEDLTESDEDVWASLYPIFAEILGRAAHYR
ncbi:MAG: hypothetical protein AAGF95_27490 [Chloroflexota bacterium]